MFHDTRVTSKLARKARYLVLAALAATLVACGGGATDGCSNLDPTRSADLPGCTAATDTGTGTATPDATVVSQPRLALALTDSSDASGAAITSIAPDRAGTLRATLKDAQGNALPNLAVTFTTTDKTGAFVPASGTALTDAAGIARVGLVAGTQAGAYTASAGAMAGSVPVSATTSYSVAFPTLAFGALVITPATISAGGTASLGVTLMNGTNRFTPAQSINFTSPCAISGKAVISSPVITVNGMASTSYTDKGCGGPDTITASTSLGGAISTQTGTVTVLGATAGQIGFVSALPQNIAMKNTGGAGRQESATVIFKVLDKNGNPVAGIPVNFSLTTTVGGLALNPASTISGADGTAYTTVAAGIVNSPVRVLATITGSALSTLSDQLVISTGISDQKSFTVTPKIYNIECANYNGTDFTTVTAFAADHFNNPVPDGTAVSFTTEAGAIDASCLTGLNETTLTDGSKILQKGIPGQCTVRFICQNPRHANGRATVLSYALGEESFLDDPTIKDGLNRYDLAESFQDLREPFRYDRAISNQQAQDVNNGNNNTMAPMVGEPFIDSDGNGTWNNAGDAFYNGVLQTTPNGKTPTIHVRDGFVLVFSGSNAIITPLSPVPMQFDLCTPKTFIAAIRDDNSTIFPGNILAGNILPAGTLIEFLTPFGILASPSSLIVRNTSEPDSAAWTYSVRIENAVLQSTATCVPQLAGGYLTVKVTTPLGTITTQSFLLSN